MLLKEVKEYHPNGQLYLHHFEDDNGLRQGEYKWYYRNGQLCVHCHYKDSKLHGKKTRYNRDGSVRSVKWFSHGEDVTEHYEKILKWKSLCS